jgi:hypothetical protein
MKSLEIIKRLMRGDKIEAEDHVFFVEYVWMVYDPILDEHFRDEPLDGGEIEIVEAALRLGEV